jgi:hypothetical protein
LHGIHEGCVQARIILAHGKGHAAVRHQHDAARGLRNRKQAQLFTPARAGQEIGFVGVLAVGGQRNPFAAIVQLRHAQAIAQVKKKPASLPITTPTTVLA